MAARTIPKSWYSKLVYEIGDFVLTASAAVALCFKPPFRLGLIIQQMDFIGVGSLFIIVLTGTFTGAVFTLQTLHAFSMFSIAFTSQGWIKIVLDSGVDMVAS